MRTSININPVWFRLFTIIKLGRLHFLSSGVLLNCLGVAIAIYSGASLDLSIFLLGQLVITSTQIMTHYSNEYYDLDADTANLTPTNWSGGSRVLVEGSLPPQVALHIALFFGAVALCGNLILAVLISPHILFITLSALLLSWFYSAPPLQLHSRGFGELSATITVTALTPLTAYVLQTHTIDTLILLAVIPLCILQFAMLISIEFPDEAGDRRVGKNTLVVRLGPQKAMLLYSGSIMMAYLILPVIVLMGFPTEVALLLILPLPLALVLLWKVWRGNWKSPQKWNSLAFYTIVLLMSTISFELVGFVLLIGFL